MSFYSKYILPRYLRWSMKSKSLIPYRMSCVFPASGVGLEVGFGSGLNLPYYKNVKKLYALDVTERPVASKQKQTSFPIEHIRASAEEVPLPSNSLDFVVSTWNLCSISRPDIALREISRVLKPGGVFLFMEHGKSPHNFIFKIQNILTPASKIIAGGCHMNRDIEQLIVSAKFSIKSIEKFSPRFQPLGFMYKGIAVAHK